MTVASTDFEIVHGRVVRTGTHFAGGTIYRNQSSAAIHSTPEIWVQMEDGREQHLRGNEFDGIREDHELVLVWPAGGGNLLRITNLNTRKTYDFDGLTPRQGAWAVVRASCWKLVTIYAPAVLVAVALGNATGLTDSFIGTLVGVALNLLFFYCFYFGWRTAEDRAARVEQRRARINALFREKGWLPGNAT